MWLKIKDVKCDTPKEKFPNFIFNINIDSKIQSSNNDPITSEKCF